MRQVSIVSIVFFFFFLFPQITFASEVVLNEFLVDPDSGQWVELYNQGADSLNISGWVIDDSGGSEKFVIPDDTTIEANGFKVFESNKFNFNTASQDMVQLIQGTITIDSFTYPKSPGQQYSYGRVADGSGVWAVFGLSTKGSTNLAISPLPSPTPTPAPIPTELPTNVPSKIPTPTKSPTKIPTKIVDIIVSPTISVSTGLMSKSTVTIVSVKPSEAAQKNKQESVLGETVVNTSPIVSSTNTSQDIKILGTTSNNWGAWFISIGGVFLLVCGILAFKTKRNHDHTT